MEANSNNKWKIIKYNGSTKYLNVETNEVFDFIPGSAEQFQAEIDNLNKKLEECEEMKNWIPIQSISVTNGRTTEMFKTKDVYKYKIPQDIPDSAKSILINSFFLNGNEQDAAVKIKIWTNKHNKNYYYFIKAWRYPQSAISYDSQNLWFPFNPEDKYVYVQSDHVQITNCHGMDLEIIGYK